MRLATGGRIDRGRALAFTFDGVAYAGHPGDTLASALLANGVHLVGRSFKYHRPRGFLGAGVEEPNALVGVTRGPGRFEPNARATCVPLTDGLVVESQNRWPSLARDLGALNDAASAFLPAGFYYKTFMWPPSVWHKLYEPRIRRLAGLGRAPDAPDPDRYATRWAHCETLVVGGGPAGLAAALSASAGQAAGRVILCDLDEEFGGALLADPAVAIDGARAADWLAATLELLAARGVRLLPRTTAIQYGIGNLVTLAQRLTGHLPPGEATGPREMQWQVRAARVVLACGAIERPLVFPGNDRPGVMLASAARAFARRWGVLAGRRAVVAIDHDSGYAAALDLADAGVVIAAIVDQRADVSQAAAAARARGMEVLAGHAIAGTRGRLRVLAAGVAPVVAGEAGAPARWFDCDLVLMAGGWTPSLHLFSQSRGTPRWDEALQAFVPGVAVQAQVSAGACNGRLDLAACLDDGHAAGGGPGEAPRAQAGTQGSGGRVAAPVRHREGARAKAFVDFQNDVTANDIGLAIREGFQSIEHIKRYTTSGMATDQGRTSNLNALGIAARTLGRTVPEVGLTTFRAPFTPATFAGFAGYHRGALFEPVRTTPMHGWAVAHGAVFEDVGQWKRARYFPHPGEDMRAAVDRECRAVRAGAGVFDASTLGKIEVAGPDAAAFLDFIYAGNFARLGAGRCRYGVMLREDGFIMDDGIAARLADDRFHITTTTGGAAAVLAHMEDFRQTELPRMRVWLTSITEQYAVIAVQGPRARDVIAPLVDGADLATAAFAHMSVRDCAIAGVPARLFRVSFTGEMGYEVNVPASRGADVLDAIVAAGAPHGLTPYGTEAMHVLRAEKGYIIVGQETDGTVTPDDAGLGWAVGKAKADFVGKRSLARPALVEAGRKQLVGLVPVDGRTVVEEGAQLVDAGAPRTAVGHVSSSYRSAAAGGPIALALLRDGRARAGGGVEVAMPGASIAMRVVAPVFVDEGGGRLNG